MRTVRGTVTFVRVKRVNQERWANVECEVPDDATEEQIEIALKAEGELWIAHQQEDSALDIGDLLECSDWDDEEVVEIEHRVTDVNPLPEGA